MILRMRLSTSDVVFLEGIESVESTGTHTHTTDELLCSVCSILSLRRLSETNLLKAFLNIDDI
jgi:hypothetical protein